MPSSAAKYALKNQLRRSAGPTPADLHAPAREPPPIRAGASHPRGVDSNITAFVRTGESPFSTLTKSAATLSQIIEGMPAMGRLVVEQWRPLSVARVQPITSEADTVYVHFLCAANPHYFRLAPPGDIVLATEWLPGQATIRKRPAELFVLYKIGSTFQRFNLGQKGECRIRLTRRRSQIGVLVFVPRKTFKALSHMMSTFLPQVRELIHRACFHPNFADTRLCDLALHEELVAKGRLYVLMRSEDGLACAHLVEDTSLALAERVPLVKLLLVHFDFDRARILTTVRGPGPQWANAKPQEWTGQIRSLFTHFLSDWDPLREDPHVEALESQHMYTPILQRLSDTRNLILQGQDALESLSGSQPRDLMALLEEFQSRVDTFQTHPDHASWVFCGVVDLAVAIILSSLVGAAVVSQAVGFLRSLVSGSDGNSTAVAGALLDQVRRLLAVARGQADTQQQNQQGHAQGQFFNEYSSMPYSSSPQSLELPHEVGLIRLMSALAKLVTVSPFETALVRLAGVNLLLQVFVYTQTGVSKTVLTSLSLMESIGDSDAGDSDVASTRSAMGGDKGPMGSTASIPGGSGSSDLKSPVGGSAIKRGGRVRYKDPKHLPIGIQSAPADSSQSMMAAAIAAAATGPGTPTAGPGTPTQRPAASAPAPNSQRPFGSGSTPVPGGGGRRRAPSISAPLEVGRLGGGRRSSLSWVPSPGDVPSLGLSASAGINAPASGRALASPLAQGHLKPQTPSMLTTPPRRRASMSFVNFVDQSGTNLSPRSAAVVAASERRTRRTSAVFFNTGRESNDSEHGSMTEAAPLPGISLNLPLATDGGGLSTSMTGDHSGMLSPNVPKLAIPQTTPRRGRSVTRSGRRASHFHDALTPFPVGLGEVTSQMHTSEQELRNLARNLGETYLASDVTTLLYHKRRMANLMGGSVLVKEAATSSKQGDDQEVPKQGRSDGFFSSTVFHLRVNVLQVLTQMYSRPELFARLPNLCNLVITELTMAHNLEQRDITTVEQYKTLLYTVLRMHAEHVEIVHRCDWTSITLTMDSHRRAVFRMQLDLFLWRLQHRLWSTLRSAMYGGDRRAIALPLKILRNYMRACPTRVMAQQVTDVCMEVLLNIKEEYFQRDRIDNYNHIVAIQIWLEVFNELIVQTPSPVLNSLLLAILVDNDDTYSFIRYFASQILFNRKLHVVIDEMADAQDLLLDCSLAVIRHYTAILHLLRHSQSLELPEEIAQTTRTGRGADLYGSGHSLPDVDQASLERFEKLEFMVHPQNGFVIHYLKQHTGPSHHRRRLAMLDLLHTLFSNPRCPFLQNKYYIDTYTSFHFLSFIKIYFQRDLRLPSIETCRHHLDVLLAISQTKTDLVVMKFNQLRVVDFLSREFNLEHEMQANAGSQQQQQQQKGPPIPSHHGGKGNRQSAGEDSNTTGELPPMELPPQHQLLRKDTGLSRSLGSMPGGADSSTGSLIVPGLVLKRSTTKDGLDYKGTDTLVETEPKRASTGSSNSLEPAQAQAQAHLGSVSSASSGSKITVPGLKLSGAITKDGMTHVGKDSMRLPSLPEYPAQPESCGDEDSPGSQQQQQQQQQQPTGSTSGPLPDPAASVKSFRVPGLKLMRSATKDGMEVRGRDTIFEDIDGTSVTTPQGSDAPAGTESQASSAGDLPPPASKARASKRRSFVLPAAAMEDRSRSPSVGPKNALGNSRHSGGGSGGGGGAGREHVDYLSSIEQKMGQMIDGPKMQLYIGNPPSPGHMQMMHYGMTPDVTYVGERKKGLLYQDRELHISLLLLTFSLLLTRHNTLQPLYCDQFPTVNRKHNILYYLHCHLNHPDNLEIVAELTERSIQFGYFRLLKLLSMRLFDPSAYRNKVKLATGAYGTVYECKLQSHEHKVAVKLVPLPLSAFDRCVLHDIFSEITILDTFRADRRVSRFFDYGVTDTDYWIVMKHYRSDLKSWRLRQQRPIKANLVLYMRVFLDVLIALRFLRENKINHYDIKCDNILLEPNDVKCSDHEFYNQPREVPNFTVHIADFGESKLYQSEKDSYTTRNRGTEFIKSPEMLTCAYASQKSKKTYDRRRNLGASVASDTWSAGCLLYELITGDFLFYDEDWVRFFIRVTGQNEELFAPDRKRVLKDHPLIRELLEYVLVRDPARRPQLEDVIVKTQATLGTLLVSKGLPPGVSPMINPVEMPQYPLTEAERVDSERQHVEALTAADGDYFYSNISFLTPTVVMGSAKVASDKRKLLKEGITHVINCTLDPNPFPAHFYYLHVDVEDNPVQDISEKFGQVTAFIEDAAMQRGRVLIYSERGVSRAPAFAAAFLMKAYAISSYEALIHVRSRRWTAQPNPGFMRQLNRIKFDVPIHRLPHGDSFYQCLCGNNVIAFDRMMSLIRMSDCDCDPGFSPDCPAASCSMLLERSRSLYGLRDRTLEWHIMPAGTAIFLYENAEEVDVHAWLPDPLQPLVPKKTWKMMWCVTCHFPVYATEETNDEVAIVTNLTGTGTTNDHRTKLFFQHQHDPRPIDYSDVGVGAAF